ncbi:unnamed protein product [Toxocara canis]|uniref:Amidase domain-containing protein n=1 Tax=Toxocara canis TaxID=6265 RepID=A0A183UZC5_TOXCA|nr:unnamed protein product [Toxocara canis]
MDLSPTFGEVCERVELPTCDASCSPPSMLISVPSVPNEYPGELPMCAFATGLFNMLDFPAGVVPTGIVTKQDDVLLEDEKSWPVGHNIALRRIREAARNSVGMPIGVQVVALPFHEEECLAVMEMVEALYNGRFVSVS